MGREADKTTSKPTGRPTKLTPETQEAVCNLLKIGATRRDAALAAGVSEPVLYLWLQRGRSDREARRRTRFVEFLEAVERAEAEARLRFTATIARAAQDGDWRAALEYLKRRDREHWGDSVDVSSGGQPIQFVVRLRNDGD